MTNEEITAMAARIEALEPRTRETVLLFLDLLLQAQENGSALPKVPAIAPKR